MAVEACIVADATQDKIINDFFGFGETEWGMEIDVEYRIYGKHLPATWFEPEEWPELEIEKVIYNKLYSENYEIDLSKLTKERYKELVDKLDASLDGDVLETLCWEYAEKHNDAFDAGDFL